MEGQHLVWRDDAGAEQAVALPRLELDQSACVPLHEHVEGIASGREVGTVRLDPALHKVAGFMLRIDPEGQTWRIQHL